MHDTQAVRRNPTTFVAAQSKDEDQVGDDYYDGQAHDGGEEFDVVVDVKTFDGGTSEQNFKVKTTETLGSVKRRLSLSMGLSPEQVSNQHWRLCPLTRACSTLPVATYSVHSS
jgi:hypothetical protein